jgi:acetoin utilization protein AcuB
MKIAAAMKRPVLIVKPHDSIRHARELLERHRINQLPVVVDGRVVGIVTDRDLRDAFPSVMEAAAPRRRTDGADPATILVEEVMTSNVLTLAPEATVEEGARLMRSERIGAIPILAGGRLIGILTRSDVLDVFLGEAERRPASSVSGRGPATLP